MTRPIFHFGPLKDGSAMRMRKPTLFAVTGLTAMMFVSALVGQSTSVVKRNGEPAAVLEIPENVNLGNDTQALEIVYKVGNAGNELPGVIDVYAIGAEGATGGDEARFLVDRLVPYAPPQADGSRRATVQISEEARRFFTSVAQPVAIQIAFDQDLSKPSAPDDLLSLKEIKVINKK